MKKLNLLALLIFLGFLVWVFMFDTPTTQAIQSKILGIFSPFIKGGGAVAEAVGGEEQQSPEELAALNVQLRREIGELRIRTQEMELIKGENRDLRTALEFTRRSEFALIPAEVISRGASTWWSTLTIDKGSNEGVPVGSPVLTDIGLVGKTITVDGDITTVLLLTDEKCRVAARVQGTREQGILMGQRGSADATPDLALRYLSVNANLEVGAKVYSQGGGVFPPGIPLGEVKSFKSGDFDGTAVVLPAVDFSSLKYVFVLKPIREDAPEIEEAVPPAAAAAGGGGGA